MPPPSVGRVKSGALSPVSRLMVRAPVSPMRWRVRSGRARDDALVDGKRTRPPPPRSWPLSAAKSIAPAPAPRIAPERRRHALLVERLVHRELQQALARRATA